MAVKLPRTSCSLCICARDPSRAVASEQTGTNSIGKTGSMDSARQLLPAKAALPASSLAAIFVRPFLPVTCARPSRNLTASQACAVFLAAHALPRDTLQNCWAVSSLLSLLLGGGTHLRRDYSCLSLTLITQMHEKPASAV